MKKLSLRNMGLGWSLTLLVSVFSVVGVAMVGVLNMRFVSVFVEENIGTDSVLMAKRMQHELGVRVSSRLESLSMYFAEPEIIANLKDANDGKGWSAEAKNEVDDHIKAAEGYFGRAGSRPVITQIGITNRQGTILSGVLSPHEGPASTWLPSVWNGSSYLGKVYADASGSLYAPFVVPVMGTDGSFLGAVTGELALDDAFKAIDILDEQGGGYWLSSDDIKKSREYTVLSSEGTILYSSTGKPALTAYDPSIRSDIESRISRNEKTGYFSAPSDEDGAYDELFAYANGTSGTVEGNSNVTVDVEYRMGTVMDQAALIVRNASVAMFVSALLVAFIFWYVIRAAIIRPLVKLNKTTKALRKDNLHFVTDVQGSNEIGELARSIGGMTKRLSDNLQEAMQLNDELQVMGHMLRHDVGNRLIFVLYTLNEIIEREKLTSEAKDRLKRSSLATENALGFIRSVQNLETAVGNGSPLRPYSLVGVIHKVEEDQGDIAITIHGEGSVRADEALYSIMTNVISNARIHGGVSTVDINIASGTDGTTVRIADQGSGMSDAMKKSLFAKGSKFGPNGRTGIGLYVVSKSMERYGGKVRVEDNDPRGTVFVLTFPPYNESDSQ